ncbi:pentatricopeptide repeat domain-containing protein 3, mitochondrial isoform X2 [Eublepharis macularius]|uniref:Small ribosomal subunit protein mS39 n=1 Tax=Eublepharis macularius TaxID=481883 RepID=A0AA97K0M5_EUBMA|nr:pentatricopeptide repeat domain-containing protein 3, mitochondrial isoform X2 [Eublepharis macularius]
MALPWRALSAASDRATWARRRVVLCRYFSGNAELQKKSPVPQVAEESIVLPRKKTWDKLAVLQALASTVHKDPTAAHSVFQDDPYLIPRTSTEFRLFSLSKESGQNAAKYIVNTHPVFFGQDIAEPHILSLMPENLALQLEEVSEAALKERIQLRKVKAAVDTYDQLQQSGTLISLETANSLLDLLCFFEDNEPVPAAQPTENRELEEQEESVEVRKQRRSFWHSTNTTCIKWRENNNAERVFSLMPEKNAHSYCTMIRGMVKHRAYSKAFDMYTDLLNNRFKADVYTFNALISSAVEVKDKFIERWELVEDLLRQMAQQNVQPNLLTFNSVLKALGQCGSLGKSMALQTLSEMSALNIEPSLATYDYLLGIFYKSAISARGPTEIIYEVVDEIEGKSFYPQDPADANFFSNAMRICLDMKDVQLAYRLHTVVETGENWKMMGNMRQQFSYYGRFLHLLCMMEHLDVILKWYKELVPSMFYPTSEGMLDLLQALDAAGRLDMIPQIWKDIKQLGHGHRVAVVEEVLALMARERQSLETQMAFADIATDIKSVYEVQERSYAPLEWTAVSLGNSALLFARAGRTPETWSMLQLFKKHSRVPSDSVMNEALDCIRQSNQPDQALDLVKLAADFSLQSTSTLAGRVLKEFQLSEEQRSALEDMGGIEQQIDANKESRILS